MVERMAEQKSLKELEAERIARQQAKASKPATTYSDEEKAARKARVEQAKDALARSVGLKGDHVAPARAALKNYLRNLNDKNQPDDARFELLIEAPFKAPPKKRTNDRY
jgi:hypothetical protein